MESLFDACGVFVGHHGIPIHQDIFVKKLRVIDAVAYRVEKRYDDKGKPYTVYLKQPKVHLKYGVKDFYIVDRRVVWDLLRNFDPYLDYRTFLEMLDYFSLHKILEDYIKDYSDKTLGIWLGSAGHRKAKPRIIMAVQTTESTENLLHGEIIAHVKERLEIDSTESFFKIGKTLKRVADANISATAIPKVCRDVYLRIIKGDKILEIKEQVGNDFDRKYKHSAASLKVFLETFDGMVQMKPATYFQKNLEFIESEKLYEAIDSALKLMDEEWEQVKDYEYRSKGSMTEMQYDEVQYLWFANSFSQKK
tara:strand:+ start:1019 stop:1939 length:921 start_codon:yes stop_codon:yes gene_type:complete